MVAIIRELFQHQAHADASMLMAIKRHQSAANDEELRKLCHHMLVAHRFWLHLCQGLPFSVQAENVVPPTFQAIVERFQATQMQERAFLDQLEADDLARELESQHLPGRRVAVSQALLQVCLHSQGHRAQCATRFRILGGEPPPTDYIHWVKERPSPQWV